jgi:hypothetical protein
MLMKYLRAFRNYIDKNNILKPAVEESVMEKLPVDSLTTDSTTVLAE